MKFDAQKARWEHFPHGADVGIRGIGATLEEAFEMGAVALTAVISDPEKIAPQIQVSIEIREVEPELLFLDWINRLIYEMDVTKVIFSQFKVKISKEGLVAQVRGDTMDSQRYDLAVEVKGATMTELKVFLHNGLWMAQCVVDV